MLFQCRWFFLLCGCLLSPWTCAQGDLPVTVSVFSESTSLPFTTLWSDPVHPGIQVGTAFHGASRRALHVYPAVNLGYLFHRNLFQGVYANVEVGVDYRHSSGVTLRSKLGTGYLLTFTTRTEYVPVDGQLVVRKDRGNHRVMPSLTFGVGYRLKPGDPRSTELFMLHQTWLEYPYAGDFIPLMSHTNLHFGATFYPFTPKSSHQ